ncbi:ATP-dependent RNA helicase SUV3 like protein, mitochondrial [Ditylenchus destructor]|nr:ATP-dependent RNA helicase SUV3 like protein, mitochondrial [Ditylenchus destructor]
MELSRRFVSCQISSIFSTLHRNLSYSSVCYKSKRLSKGGSSKYRRTLPTRVDGIPNDQNDYLELQKKLFQSKQLLKKSKAALAHAKRVRGSITTIDKSPERRSKKESKRHPSEIPGYNIPTQSHERLLKGGMSTKQPFERSHDVSKHSNRIFGATKPVMRSRRYLRGVTLPLEAIVEPRGLSVYSDLYGYGMSCSEDPEFDPVKYQRSIRKILDHLFNKEIVRELAAEENLTGVIYDKSEISFREYCTTPDIMDELLKITVKDIEEQGHSVDLMIPYFLAHAKKIFPHLECLRELKQKSDLTQIHNWYPTARAIHRKIIFHAGPTNSGKTYEALERFKAAKSGAYCAPLRLLAAEIYRKVNEAGVPCDLLTGEDRRFANENGEPAAHIASTVEMMSPYMPVDMTVIDEIQMVRDEIRGYAFTRALLGAAAPEVHVCGEEAAIDIVQRLLDPIGEHVEIRRYKRKSKLTMSTHGLNSLKNLEDGDCIVCFSKMTIMELVRKIGLIAGRECAIIFGDLPPNTKLAQAAKFNDPNHPCKILIATDAIGMGMNLNIKRIIFHDLARAALGEKLMPNYFARQIAGRAGRFGMAHEEGKVMGISDKNNGIIKELLNEEIPNIEKAGVSPTWQEIEMFSFLLPHCSLGTLLDIFSSICNLSDNLFLSLPNEMRNIAEELDNIPMQLKDKWTFCLVPIRADENRMKMYKSMVEKYINGESVTYDFLFKLVKPYLEHPGINLLGLNRLTDAHDIVGAYLWLSYRFQGYFPDTEKVRDLEERIEQLFQKKLNAISEVTSRKWNNDRKQRPIQVDK